MKKIILAAAAVAALAAGASSAQAKVNFDVYLGGFGHGGHHGYYAPVDYGYNTYEPDCHYVKVKTVKWVYGKKIVKFKKKLVCDSY